MSPPSIIYIFVNTAIIFVIDKFCFADTHTYALVKPYFCHHTTFQTFQDLFEHTFVYINVICEIFSSFCQHCVTKPPKHYYSVHLRNSGLSLSLMLCQYSKFFKSCPKLFHCKKGDVAVYEYANSTSAHDTVLEHRFSPMCTSFTS